MSQKLSSATIVIGALRAVFYLGFWETTFVFTYGKISQRFWENNPQNTQNWENIDHFLIGNGASIRR